MERTLKNFIEARKMYEDIVANGKQKIDQYFIYNQDNIINCTKVPKLNKEFTEAH